MLRFLTAGESHGRALVTIIEGLPAGLELNLARINGLLKRRQGGYGRGKRMTLEEDQVEIFSGLRGAVTLGTPLTLVINNRDWENWQEIMAPGIEAKLGGKMVTSPRPGHADLAGGLKYRQEDLRNILERASARETAARVAVGAVAEELLFSLGIRVQGQVIAIGNVSVSAEEKIVDSRLLYKNPLYCPAQEASLLMIKAIEEAEKQGDSLGGVIQVVAEGVPVGLGSHVQWDRRLDGQLAQALMSIPAIKGVEIGGGFSTASLLGSQVHDEIEYQTGIGFRHRTNRAGGIEGGISNGEPLVIRAAMKPIPTLAKPLASVEWQTKKTAAAAVERADVCAVPAAAIVGEAVTAWVLAAVVMEKFGGDHLKETLANYKNYL
ncbi:MAG: chorismate synthase, partial [Clostridia bacterium]|nr:chorismate synthase [Clostridia bacterium]MDD4665650.1 chorismate synthase [Clostridia bacterium]